MNSDRFIFQKMMTKLKWNELDMNSARFVSIDDDQVEIE
jgi:hypothetical protein